MIEEKSAQCPKRANALGGTLDSILDICLNLILLAGMDKKSWVVVQLI